MTREHRRRTGIVIAALGLVVTTAVSADGQTQSLDRGVLLILQDGELIGREEFAVRRGTTSATMTGFTLASTALYPADRPQYTLVSVIELGPDSFPQSSRFEHGNSDAFRVAIGIGPRRIAVRRATANGESAREHPARNRPLIVDDSVFVSLAVRPPTTGPARSLSMDGVLGETLEVTDLGVRPTTLRGRNVDLQLIRLQAPAGTLSAWYDGQGRLMKIEWPGRSLTAIRESDP